MRPPVSPTQVDENPGPVAASRKGDSELDMLKQIGRNYRW
jgi:hypothetical protein